MLAERDTRVETLIPGDRFRWVGRCYTVVHLLDVVSGAVLRQVGVQVTPGNRGEGAVLLFPIGHCVAAECLPRSA